MTFKTSLDALAKVVTISVTILFAVIITGQVILFKNDSTLVPTFIGGVLVLIYCGTYLLRPVNYTLTCDKLIIHRPWRDINIDRKKIVSVRRIDKETLKWTIRTFGVGGLFGYWGQFANPKIGAMTWYATRRDNAVLIKTIWNAKILLTPDEPEKFVAEFTLQNLEAAT